MILTYVQTYIHQAEVQLNRNKESFHQFSVDRLQSNVTGPLLLLPTAFQLNKLLCAYKAYVWTQYTLQRYKNVQITVENRNKNPLE